MPDPLDLHPALAPVAAFAGRWVGSGEGSYPTIDDFAYTEELELRPVPGKPLLAYRSATRAADDGRALHGETGFLRPVGDGRVELVVAHGFGLVEVAEGTVAGDAASTVLTLTSTGLLGTSTAKAVEATERRLRLEDGALVYDVAMAAVGVPMTHHLHARLTSG